MTIVSKFKVTKIESEMIRCAIPETDRAETVTEMRTFHLTGLYPDNKDGGSGPCYNDIPEAEILLCITRPDFWEHLKLDQEVTVTIS